MLELARTFGHLYPHEAGPRVPCRRQPQLGSGLAAKTVRLCLSADGIFHEGAYAPRCWTYVPCEPGLERCPVRAAGGRQH